MKKLLIAAAFTALFISAQSQKNTISVIPQPASIVQGDAGFILPHELFIILPQNEELKKIASRLAAQLSAATGYDVKINEGNTPVRKSIFLSLSGDKSIPKEGYRLQVTTNGITLTATEPAGIFYGVQTLLQLLPKEIVSKPAKKKMNG